MSSSLRPHGLQPTGFLCPWDSPGKNTGVDCHFLFQGIFPTQGLNLHLLHCRQILYQWATGEAHYPSPINILPLLLCLNIYVYWYVCACVCFYLCACSCVCAHCCKLQVINPKVFSLCLLRIKNILHNKDFHTLKKKLMMIPSWYLKNNKYSDFPSCSPKYSRKSSFKSQDPIKVHTFHCDHCIFEFLFFCFFF